MIFGDWFTNSVWPWLGQIRTSLLGAARMTAVSVVWRRHITWMKFVVMSWERCHPAPFGWGWKCFVSLLGLVPKLAYSMGMRVSWTHPRMVTRPCSLRMVAVEQLLHFPLPPPRGTMWFGPHVFFLQRASVSKLCGQFRHAACPPYLLWHFPSWCFETAWLFEGKDCGCTRCACHCHALRHKCRITGSFFCRASQNIGFNMKVEQLWILKSR